MNDDNCKHDVNGFCMLCCREGEGKSDSSYQWCQYGRNPIVSVHREVCYGPGNYDGFCDEHKHLAGTKEEVYLRAKNETS